MYADVYIVKGIILHYSFVFLFAVFMFCCHSSLSQPSCAKSSSLWTSELSSLFASSSTSPSYNVSSTTSVSSHFAHIMTDKVGVYQCGCICVWKFRVKLLRLASFSSCCKVRALLWLCLLVVLEGIHFTRCFVKLITTPHANIEQKVILLKSNFYDLIILNEKPSPSYSHIPLLAHISHPH